MIVFIKNILVGTWAQNETEYFQHLIVQKLKRCIIMYFILLYKKS